MSKEVGAGGRSDIFLDSAKVDRVTDIVSIVQARRGTCRLGGQVQRLSH